MKRCCRERFDNVSVGIGTVFVVIEAIELITKSVGYGVFRRIKGGSGFGSRFDQFRRIFG